MKKVDFLSANHRLNRRFKQDTIIRTEGRFDKRPIRASSHAFLNIQSFLGGLTVWAGLLVLSAKSAFAQTQEGNPESSPSQEIIFYLPYFTLGFFVLLLIFLLITRSSQKSKKEPVKTKDLSKYASIDWEPKATFEKEAEEKSD